MKNYQTPRTLADCRFDVGYPTAPVRRPSRLADVLFATVLGTVGAALLVHFLAR